MHTEIPRFTKTEFKQLRYLIFFALFIIVFQVLQYVTTKKVSKNYTSLSHEVTDIVLLTNSISFENSFIHRALLNLTISTDSVDSKKFESRLLKSEKITEENFALISDKIISYELYSFKKLNLFWKFKLAKHRYKQTYKNYLSKLKTTTVDEKLAYRKNILRPALANFQIAQNLFLLQLFSDQSHSMEKIAIHGDRTGITLLLIGNFLLGFIILFMLYIVITERKNLA